MKAFRIFKKSISESFKGVFRNGALSLAAISSITITLVLVGFSIILSYNVHNFTKEIEKDLTIVVFLDRDTDSDTVKEIKNKIEDIGNIRKIEFNSKEDVRKEMQGESEIFESIMSQYTPETNPLQDTYLVKVDDIVTKDTVIGYMGASGSATGYHLHLAIATGLKGVDYYSYSSFVSRTINPRKLINFPSYGSWKDRVHQYN